MSCFASFSIHFTRCFGVAFTSSSPNNQKTMLGTDRKVSPLEVPILEPHPQVTPAFSP